MAETMDDDAWLYGDSAGAEETEEKDIKDVNEETGESEPIDQQENGETPYENSAEIPAEEDAVEPSVEEEVKDEENNTDEKEEEEEKDDEEDEDDSDDDDIQITIDKSTLEEAKNTFQNVGMGKSRSAAPAADKKGKFNVQDFEQPGQVNGKEPHEIDMENVEEKPWKKPGADITDYFNYGFTEDTWQAYCQRQRKIRLGESGVGLPTGPVLAGGTTKVIGGSMVSTIPTLGAAKNLIRPPPPSTIKRLGDKDDGLVDTSIPPPLVKEPTTISVMTSDKRTYSNKVIDAPRVDFSVPPPGMSGPPPGMGPPPAFSGPPPIHASSGGADFDYSHGSGGEDYDNYYQAGYEPTQESQWAVPPPSFEGGGPPPGNSDAPPGDAGYDERENDRDPWKGRRSSRDTPPRRERRDYDRKRRRSRSRSPRDRYKDYRDRERDRDHRDHRHSDRDHERSRDRDRDRRDRERSSRRDRSRSRSRSPSHKHKKSKRDRDKKDRVEIKREIKEEPAD